MLLPRKVKHRKWFKGRSRNQGVATSKKEISFGQYGLKSLGYCWMSSRQIEAARRAMIRSVKKGGKIWIRVFPDKPITTKGEQAKMGKGKGSLDHYAAVVKPGTVLFEMDGITREVAEGALRLASYKLPVKTKFIVRE